jgi:hypothetical protein
MTMMVTKDAIGIVDGEDMIQRNRTAATVRRGGGAGVDHHVDISNTLRRHVILPNPCCMILLPFVNLFLKLKAKFA